jgi:hypothetical protein
MNINKNSYGLECIFVIGMHRSGTSLITELLSNMGYFPGKDDSLLAPDEHNQRGYFELKDITYLNELLLTEAAVHYFAHHYSELEITTDDILNLGWVFGLLGNFHDILDKRHLFRMHDIIASYLENPLRPQRIVIKDPRLSFTLPCWAVHFSKPLVILMVRDPASVAASLKKRDAIPLELGRELWRRYNVAALDRVQGTPHRIVNYDKLLENPNEELERLHTFLFDHSFLPDVTAFEDVDLSEVIDRNLRHWQASDNPWALQKSISSLEDIRAACDRIGSQSDDWFVLKAMHLLIRTIRDNCGRYSRELENTLLRLNNHPFVGMIIRTLRKIKRDPTFGRHD